jgi:flagellar basal-body rod modification protein FlgD
VEAKMLYGVSNTPVFSGKPNSRIVDNPDPNNPVVTEPEELSSSESFMTLMLEQLKNQDPMNPADSNAMTQQLAALNTVEQLISLNSIMEDMATQSQLADATALIGNYVEGIDGDSNIITGVVDHVEMIEGAATLIVDDMLLLPSQVYTVAKAEADVVDDTTGEDTTADDTNTDDTASEGVA